MENYICATCGVQYAASQEPPGECPICEDERQYLRPEGQQWTTLAKMKEEGYRNRFRSYEPGLTGIGTEPNFAIGQRALLVQTDQGNVLWDCITLIDDETIQAVKALGGVQAITICHPHFYDSMVEWSHAFDNAPIYLHAADSRWVMRPDPAIQFWNQPSIEVLPGITVVHCGGHFEGSTVLHWEAGAEGRGVLLTGDTIQVVQDRRHLSFLRSYPNMIPLSPRIVRRIVKAVARYRYDRIYGIRWDLVIPSDARAAVARSAERYIRRVTDA